MWPEPGIFTALQNVWGNSTEENPDISPLAGRHARLDIVVAASSDDHSMEIYDKERVIKRCQQRRSSRTPCALVGGLLKHQTDFGVVSNASFNNSA
jgi:hypothetical protein